MTAIPGAPSRRHQSPSSVLTLICDGCGHSTTRNLAKHSTWPQLWHEVHDTGWRGRPWSFGPHYCPTCAEPTNNG